MKKSLKQLGFCLAAAGLVFGLSLLRDRETLNSQLIRLHVVADSDSSRDQQAKLQVRDAILGTIGEDLQKAGSLREAEAYLREKLPRLRAVAENTLRQLGISDAVAVSLQQEGFPKRVYDSFSLPAGVYESLKITIGRGEGHNWWCVAFPTLCLPAEGRDLQSVAAEAGFSDSLTGAITGEKPYSLRFYLLDLLGAWQAGRKSP